MFFSFPYTQKELPIYVMIFANKKIDFLFLRNLWLFKMSALIVFGRAIELLHASANIQMDSIRLCLLLCTCCVLLLLRHTLAIQMRQISLTYIFLIMFFWRMRESEDIKAPFSQWSVTFHIRITFKETTF